MNSTRIKGILLFLLSAVAIGEMRSQNIAINAGGASANLSAILDLDGVTGFTGPNGYKGLLIPRMTLAQRTGIVTLPAAAQGLVVYQTNGVEGFYYNISTTTTPNWLYLASAGTNWALLGNTGITQPASPGTYGTSTFGAGENWMGTTDNKDVVFGTNDIERMRLFSSGQLSIGTSAAGAKLDVNQTTGTAVGRFTTYGNTNDIELRRSQGTQAAPTATTGASTVLGRIFAMGYNGASYTSAASISMETDATGGTSTDMPGRIVFNTVLDGTGTPLVERMRITNAGLVGIGGVPITSLDVNGAYSARFSTAVAAAAVTLPTNVSLFRLSATAGAQANAITPTTPQDGQYLTIINEDDNSATFAGFTIPAITGTVAGVGSFVYSGTGSVWREIAIAPSSASAWSLTGNAATTPSSSPIATAIGAGQNYVGTSDSKDFVIGTNNLERMRVNAAGNIGIGAAPTTTAHITGSVSGALGGLFASEGILYTATSTNATMNNNNHTGAQFQARAASASKVKNLYGVEGDAIMGQSIATGLATGQVVGVYGTATGLSGIASTTVSEVYGVLGMPQYFDPLNSTNTAGIASQFTLFSGAPVITNLSLFKGICNAGDIGSGAITNLYGINIPVLTKTAPATVSTAYGAYIDMPTAGTSNYGAYIGGTLGVGIATPAQALDVYSKFQVNSTGDIVKINNVTTTWPTSNSAGVLTNNGSGTLTWAAASGGSGWALTGNAGTDGGTTNFIGTTDAKAFCIRVGGATTAFRSGMIDPVATSGTFFGYQSGKNVAAGATNINSTGFGYQALSVVASFGTHNSAFGKQALVANTDGFSNTAIGSLAMISNVHGGQNTALGVNALSSNAGDGSSTGLGNTAIGFQALYFNSNGNYNTAVGYQSYMSNTFNNCMTLGADPSGSFLAPTANNQVWIGDAGITSIKGQVAHTVYSDARIKNNVQENVPGLAFINELRPVTYNYDYNKEIELSGGKKTPDWNGKYDIEKIKFSGFIAQEVEAAANKVGYDFSGVDRPKNGKGLYGLRYSDFVVPLVKAVQELNKENESLKAKVDQISADNKAMKAELDKIKFMLEASEAAKSVQ